MRIRHGLPRQSITAVIPAMKQRGTAKRGRPLSVTAEHSGGRNVLERWGGWLQACRGVATRYEQLALNYLGVVKLAMFER